MRKLLFLACLFAVIISLFTACGDSNGTFFGQQGKYKFQKRSSGTFGGGISA